MDEWGKRSSRESAMVLGKRLNGFTGVLAGGYVIYQKELRNAHMTPNSLNFNRL